MARLSNNSLSYTGVASATPPNFVRHDRAPTTKDYKNFNIGDIWSEKNTENIWMLTDVGSSIATWTDISISGSGIFTDVTITPGDLTINEGDINMPLGDINLTDGSINLTNGDINITNGDLTLSTTEGALLSDGSGNITSSAGILDYVLTSTGPGSIPTWQASSVGTVTSVTAGTNLNDSGTATDPIINLDDSISLTAMTLSGDLTVDNVVASGDITTSAGNIEATLGSVEAGTTVTAGTGLNVTTGGITSTGTTTLNDLTEGVLLSNGSGVVSSSAGTSDYVLTSNGPGAVPTWQPDATTGAGGPYSSMNFVNISSTGSTTLVKNTFYIDKSTAGHTFNLPTTADVGDTFIIAKQTVTLTVFTSIQSTSASQKCNLLINTTTSSSAWSIDGTNYVGTHYRAYGQIVCTVANSEFYMFTGMESNGGKWEPL